MSSRKTRSKSQVGEETTTLRRSNRTIGRKVADVLPEPIRRCRGVNRKKKKVSEQVEEEEEEEQQQLTDHQMPKGQTGVPLVEVSSPEEEKPSRDILFMLQHEMKPNSREELLPEDRQHLENAATVLKSQLMSRLTGSSDILRTGDMIDLANICYGALRGLGDNYKSFSTEVNKMIAQHQELAFATKERENWTDRELETRYIQQEKLRTDVCERLFTAQCDVDKAKNKVESLKLQKEKLEAAIHEEEERLEALTTEMDRFKNTYDQIDLEVEKLEAEKIEASAKFEAINGRYNTAKEEFKRMCDHLQQSR